MRFQQALLLQKQLVQQEEQQEQTQQLLEQTLNKVQAEYELNKRLHDPLGRSIARIHSFQKVQRNLEIAEAKGPSSSLHDAAESSNHYVKKEITVRKLNDTEMHAQALKMYRQLRFDSQKK